jgi:hypothetical protein
MASGSNEQFAQVPKSSDVPVSLASYQSAQGRGRIGDVEIEDVLDGWESFLGEGDVDGVIERSGVAVEGS